MSSEVDDDEQYSSARLSCESDTIGCAGGSNTIGCAGGSNAIGCAGDFNDTSFGTGASDVATFDSRAETERQCRGGGRARTRRKSSDRVETQTQSRSPLAQLLASLSCSGESHVDECARVPEPLVDTHVHKSRVDARVLIVDSSLANGGGGADELIDGWRQSSTRFETSEWRGTPYHSFRFLSDDKDVSGMFTFTTVGVTSIQIAQLDELIAPPELTSPTYDEATSIAARAALLSLVFRHTTGLVVVVDAPLERTNGDATLLKLRLVMPDVPAALVVRAGSGAAAAKIVVNDELFCGRFELDAANVRSGFNEPSRALASLETLVEAIKQRRKAHFAEVETTTG